MSTTVLERVPAQEADDLETWRNATPGIVIIVRFSELGRLVDHVVHGGRTVSLSPRERRINSERSATDKLNPFRNGTMQPVRLIDTEVDTAEIAASPNVMGEAEMAELFKLFKGHDWKAFQARVETIQSGLLLHRLLEIASSDEVNATVRQVDVIKARMTAIENPGEAIEEVSTSVQPIRSL